MDDQVEIANMKELQRPLARRFPLFATVLALLLLFWNTSLRAQIPQEAYKVVQVLSIIEQLYVDSINNNEVADKAIRSLLTQLDPHSMYFTKEEAAEMNDELQGHFYGIGIEFSIVRDTLRVMAAIPDGPSEKVGIRAGDRIIEVDTINIAGVKLTNARVVKLLRGEKGSRVGLTVLRNSQDTLHFTINRGEIPLKSVDVVYLIDPDIGYVRINRFSATTGKEFNAALASLKKQGAKKFLLDLRSNPGGILQSAIETASEFLSPGNLVVYVEGRSVPRMESTVPRALAKYQQEPLVVLVDENSASASEIVSGAIQDWDRGVIVGRRTFGKGLVQNQIPLIDGSIIRITVSRYHTPSGRVIQTPYELGDSKGYAKKFFDRYSHGELFSKDSIKLDGSHVFHTLRKGRQIYGGGGILPDAFVPYDTLHGSYLAGRMDSRGLISNEVMDYVDEHASDLKRKYPTYEDFVQKYKIPKRLMNELLEKAKEAKITGYRQNSPEEAQTYAPTQEDKKALRFRIKMYMVRALFSFDKMIQYANTENDVVKKGVDILTNWDQEGRKLLEAPR